MGAQDTPIEPADIADGLVGGPAEEEWSAANPDLADEVAIARSVHLLLAELRDIPVPLPPEFEARLLARCHEDATLLHLLDLGLARGGRALVDLLEALFGLLPAPQPPAA